MKEDRLRKVASKWSALNMIWFAMFFSALAYGLLGLLAKGYIGFSLGESTLSKLRTVFYLLSIGTITYSVFARRTYMRRAEKTEDFEKALELYGTAVIVSVVVASSVGVLGFLLILAGDRFYGFPLLITAGLAMLYHRPRRDEMLSLAERG